MLSAVQPPFFKALASSRRILIAGMGGGFDVFCGLPLYFALTAVFRAAQGRKAPPSTPLQPLSVAVTRSARPR